MLDLKFILQNPELIQYACDKKHIKDFNVKDLISTNTRRVDLLKEVESLRKEQNDASDRISSGSLDSIGRESLIARMKNVKEELIGKEESLKMVMAEWQKLMLSVPNIPDMTVPDGESDEQNVTIKE
jgi:seryl-tRNA synthetase